jgi:hypothetical protein
MKDQYFGLITKYAVLLSVFHIMSFAFSRAIMEYVVWDGTGYDAAYWQSASFVFNILLNLLSAYILNRDIKKHNINTNFVLLSTIVYRPLGVVSFFLFIIFQNREQADNKIGTD